MCKDRELSVDVSSEVQKITEKFAAKTQISANEEGLSTDLKNYFFLESLAWSIAIFNKLFL